jgi:hypothetical protein
MPVSRTDLQKLHEEYTVKNKDTKIINYIREIEDKLYFFNEKGIKDLSQPFLKESREVLEKIVDMLQKKFVDSKITIIYNDNYDFEWSKIEIDWS